MLPEGVQQVIDGEVTAFSFMLSVRGTAATPVGLDIAVQTTTPWTILQGVLELKRLQLALELSWENGPKLLGGAVGGALMLGDVEVDVSVPLPRRRAARSWCGRRPTRRCPGSARSPACSAAPTSPPRCRPASRASAACA